MLVASWIWNTGCCWAVRRMLVEPFRVGCKWWRVTSSLQFFCVCVCNKNSCAPFKCERSACNPTTKQGVLCVCVWRKCLVRCSTAPVLLSCGQHMWETETGCQIERFEHVPFRTAYYVRKKNADRKCTSYFIEQKQCSDSNLIITMRGM